MEVKNIFDFESKIDYILKDYEELDIELQEAYLNSNSITKSFNSIESSMNDIYEKIRMLEEIIGYAQLYISNEIDATVNECRELLSDIENLNDAIFNDTKNYTTINVPLINNDTSQYTDRDGSIIKTCEPYNSIISLSGIVKTSVDIKNVTSKSSEQHIDSNIESFPNEPYRVKYLLDNIRSIGIIEILQFNFDEPQAINSIKIKLSNCDIVDITYLYEDGTEKVSEDFIKGIITEKIVCGVKVKIKSTNYSIVTVENKAKIQNYFEDIIGGII